MDYSIDPSLLAKPYNELPKLNGEEQAGIPLSTGVEQEPKTEEVAEVSSSSEEEGTVPYRRFKKFHDAAKDAEREAEFWRNRAMEVEERRSYQEPQRPQYQTPNFAPTTYQGDLPPYWVQLYGDSDAARQAYSVELQREQYITHQAFERAEEAYEQRQVQREQAVTANRQSIDSGLEEAADILGRDLTPNEELALLEIQDEFSPKDRAGNIMALLPAEKAVEIYQMQQTKVQQSPRRAVRQAVAAVSGSSSGGDTSVSVSQTDINQKFMPTLSWRANFKRLTGRDPNTL